MSLNTYEAMQTLEAERREHQAEMVSMHTGFGSRTRGAAARVLERSARAETTNVNAYLYTMRRHAEAMGRPMDVYDSFMEIIRGVKDESRTSMDVRRRITLLLEGYPAYIKVFSMLLPFVFEDVDGETKTLELYERVQLRLLMLYLFASVAPKFGT
ncbi:hypothetical protein BDZ94DRAFT_310489 [Collybia nuda]|uniref:Uncharacterized protein n=1 Tax=Collybia nuda TaxID=64659 RepID=A0A9P6C923_9AGAR|nr:hypothetical protein BDZ94DRAFT_310489 [Collybia nuda]